MIWASIHECIRALVYLSDYKLKSPHTKLTAFIIKNNKCMRKNRVGIKDISQSQN